MNIKKIINSVQFFMFILLTLIIFGVYECNVFCHKWDMENKRIAEQQKEREIRNCKDEGGHWTWGYFPLGIKSQTIKIEFCEKRK